ncbi:MAG: hypothetical protein IJI10_01415 [Eubacterium sp.]|nr:hypothetical protein [Eubacterium sp.]
MDEERIEEELLATDSGGAEAQETEEERYQRLEAELRSELEAEADRRVTEALKKLDRKHKRELKEAQEAELEDKRKAAEIRAAQLAEKEYQIRLRGNRLDLIDIISELEIPGKMRELIPCDDLLEIEDDKARYRALRDRVIDIWAEFRKQVRKAADIERAKYRV